LVTGNCSVVRLRVRFGETDLMGIVHHASYLSYLEVARVEWLRRRGVSYAQWARLGRHLAVAEVAVKYKAPVRFDDEMDIETSLSELRAATVRFNYRVVRCEGALLCAEGTTLLACVDENNTVRRLTPEMVAVFNEPER
jgi:acyl-CoA thioester hydrolase